MKAGETANSEKKISESENKKLLWFVTELYYPENNQTGYYLTGIGEGLADEFDVKVICGQPNYAARGTRAPRRETRKNVDIFRVWGTTLDKNILIFRLANMITLGFSMFFKTLAGVKKNDEIIVVSAPPTLPFIAAFAAKLRSVPYTLIIQDKYPETLTAVGALEQESLFVKFLERANEWLYGGAKRIVVVGRDMAELVAKQLKAADKSNEIPIHTIQNWASLEEIEPLPRYENELLKKLKILNKFVFLYAGNMGYPQDLDSIVACAKQLKEDERFYFLFVGSGVKRKWLEREIEVNDLRNAALLEAYPRSEQNKYLNACDVGLVSLVKKMRGVAMPSRTYNLMAAGKPILALTEKNSEVEIVLREEKIGWSVAPGEPEKLLKVIREIYDRKDELEEMGINSRNAALTKYSLDSALIKYKAMLK